MSGLALLGVSTSDSSSSGDDEVCEVSACVREVVKRRRAAIMVWQRKRPRVRMKPRRSRCAFDWDAHVQQLTPHEFRKLYRMEHTAFIKMVDAVTPNLKPIDRQLHTRTSAPRHAPTEPGALLRPSPTLVHSRLASQRPAWRAPSCPGGKC